MPLAAILEAPARIAAAIKKASQATGADFDYLLKTAARESSFRAGARSGTSSAAGLFQFIEDTWLRMVKQQGPRFGLGHLSESIVEDRDGRGRVADPEARREILKLRHDPDLSALMAGAFTQANAGFMAEKLGRRPTEGELYIAHFFGAPRGARFVQLAEARPDLRADAHFAREARANRSIFYEAGRPKTLAQVYATLVSGHGGTPTPAPALAHGFEPAQAEPDAVRGFRPVKVAALVEKTLHIRPDGASVSGPGGIGLWQTIVLPGPSAEAPVRRDQDAGRRPISPPEGVTSDEPSAPRRARTPAPPPMRAPTAPVAAPATALEPRVRADSSLLRVFGDDFWGRQSGG